MSVLIKNLELRTEINVVLYIYKEVCATYLTYCINNNRGIPFPVILVKFAFISSTTSEINDFLARKEVQENNNGVL